jgi:hypothetical protein
MGAQGASPPKTVVSGLGQERSLRYAATDAWVGYLLHERISALTPLTKAQRAKAKAKAKAKAVWVLKMDAI